MTSKPVVKLEGENGNVFNVIGLCRRALQKGHEPGDKGWEIAEEFKQRAFACHSYDEVLQLAMEYCEVE